MMQRLVTIARPEILRLVATDIQVADTKHARQQAQRRGESKRRQAIRHARIVFRSHLTPSIDDSGGRRSRRLDPPSSSWALAIASSIPSMRREEIKKGRASVLGSVKIPAMQRIAPHANVSCERSRGWVMICSETRLVSVEGTMEGTIRRSGEESTRSRREGEVSLAR